MTESTGAALSALPIDAITRKVFRERRIDESCTPGQWLSIALFVTGVVLLVRARKLPPTMPVPLPPKPVDATETGAPSAS